MSASAPPLGNSMTGPSRGEGFVLPKIIQFGYHEYHSLRMRLTEEKQRASKEDPENSYAHGVVYGAQPLRGDVEFEVELTSYGTGWSGNLKLGVMRCQGKVEEQSIPRYSPEAKEYCVWCANKLHDHMVTMRDQEYGEMNLDDLREGDRLGLKLRRDGTLNFLVNGHAQGIAAQNVYKRGWNVFIVVDHYANCRATKITRAVMRVEYTLQELCLQTLAQKLLQQHIQQLPLPSHLKVQLQLYYGE